MGNSSGMGVETGGVQRGEGPIEGQRDKKELTDRSDGSS